MTVDVASAIDMHVALLLQAPDTQVTVGQQIAVLARNEGAAAAFEADLDPVRTLVSLAERKP